MNFIFICGCLESGLDGVGDYTRLLANALSDLGHKVAICALTDNYCSAPLLTGGKPGASQMIPHLRLPQSLGWSAKRHVLRGWLGNWKPDIVSLQYVPYAFNPRGMPVFLSLWLKAFLPGNFAWHVMFHELWLGSTRKSPWKHHVIGSIQRQIVRHLVRTLRPVICHTSNALYVTMLNDAGIKSIRLPMGSSIPLTSDEREWMQFELARMGISTRNREQWWIAGTFGRCHPDVPVELQARNVVNEAEKKGKTPIFLGIGGGLGTGSEWEARVLTGAPKALVRHFGRQSATRVSAFLSSLDYGLTNCPREYIGKSSTAAAMWAHGVKLDDNYHVNLPEYKGRCGEEIPDQLLFMTQDDIAKKLISDLTN